MRRWDDDSVDPWSGIYESHRRILWLEKTTDILIRFRRTRTRAKVAVELVVAFALATILFAVFGTVGIVVAVTAFFLRELMLTLLIELLVTVIVKHVKLP